MDEDDPDTEELWVIRWDKTTQGQSMRQALLLLGEHNVLEMALGGAGLREDRAPRGPLVRQAEGVLEDYLGKRRSNNQAASK